MFKILFVIIPVLNSFETYFDTSKTSKIPVQYSKWVGTQKYCTLTNRSANNFYISIFSHIYLHTNHFFFLRGKTMDTHIYCSLPTRFTFIILIHRCVL